MNLEQIAHSVKKYFAKIVGISALTLSSFFTNCTMPVTPPTPNPPPSNDLPSNTHILSSSEATSITVSDNSILFSQNPGYFPGQIIVSDITSNTPNGLLRKIVSVSGNTVYTTQATLEEALQNADFEATKSVPLSSAKSAAKSLSLFSYNWTLPQDFILLDLNNDTIDNNDQIKLKAGGGITINSDLYLKFKIENFILKQMTFKNVITDSVNFTAVSSIPTQPIQPSEIVIFSKNFAPFTIGYLPTTPPFPIVIVPKFSIVGGIEGNASISSEASISQDAILTLGLSYDYGNWTPIKTFTNNFTWNPPTISQTNSIKFYCGPKMGFYLYGVAGPYGKLDAYLKLITNANYLNFYGGLEGLLGVDGKIFGAQLANYSNKVLNYEEFLGQVNLSPPPATKTIDLQAVQDAYFHTAFYSDGSKYYSENNSQNLNVSYYNASGNGTEDDSYIQFSLANLPADSTITSAKIKLYGYSPENISIFVNKVLNSWTETNNASSAGKPSYTSSYASFNMSALSTQWYECDITNLTNEWKSGANYGLALTGSGYYTLHQFNSRENSNGPILEITYY